MPKSRSRKKNPPKRVLSLSDLEHAKTAGLNSLTSASGQRTYDQPIREFVAWYCSELRLAFNRTVVLRYRIHLEQRPYATATINLRLAAVRRVAYEAADAGLLSPELAAGIRLVEAGQDQPVLGPEVRRDLRGDAATFIGGHRRLGRDESEMDVVVGDTCDVTVDALATALIGVMALQEEPHSSNERALVNCVSL
jgi:hypothetical protein